jgi:uncharacterized membrane protein YidH (DUF202 family)
VSVVADDDAHDQYERTQLAWRRTALALFGTGLVVAHLATRGASRWSLVGVLVGVSAVVAYVWLSGRDRIAVTGLVMVAGVLVLGMTALVGVIAR